MRPGSRRRAERDAAAKACWQERRSPWVRGGRGTAPGCITPGRAACPAATRRSKKQLTDSLARFSGTPDARGMAQSAIGAVEPIGNEEDPGYGVPDLGGPGGALVAGLARDRGDQLVAQGAQSS